MSVYGIGTLGTLKDGSKPKTSVNGKMTREYILWRDMLKRCYSEKYHEKQPTYKDCKVCDRWLVFSNFLEDLPLIENYEFWKNNPNQRIAIDKDSKIEGNKIYSLDACCFISQSDNSKERNLRCGNPAPRKKVMAISLTDEKVIVFQSMVQAEKLGFKASNICACCKGKIKHYKGYKWKYVDEKSEPMED